MLRTSVILSIAIAFAGTQASAQTTSAKAQKKPAVKKVVAATATSSSTRSVANTVTTQLRGAAPSDVKNQALTEAAFQAPKGQTTAVIQPVYRTLNNDYKISVPGGKYKASDKYEGFLIQARVDHGLENGWSLRGEAGYGQLNVTRDNPARNQNDSKAQGFTDLSFTLQKLAEVQKGQMFYGTQIGFSPFEHVYSSSFKGGPSQEGNLYSGGHSVAPFVGLQQDQIAFVRGIKAQYRLMFDRSETDKGVDGTNTVRSVSVTRSKGNVLSVMGFFEKPQANRLLGAQATFSRIESTDYSIASAKYSSDAYNEIGFGVYGRIPYNREVELLPALTYRKPLVGSGGSLDIEDSSAETNVALAARWAL